MTTKAAAKVVETKVRTFGPTQKGFNKKDPTTWSKGFRELVLDIFFERDPKGFENLHKTQKGNGVNILQALKATRAPVLARWTRVTLTNRTRPTTDLKETLRHAPKTNGK